MTDELNDVDLNEETLNETNTEAEAEAPQEAQLPPGYKTKEQLIAEGKDPSGWLPPEAFAEKKERIKSESRSRKVIEDLQQQMASLNKFHAQQLKVMREQLESKRDDAILTGDVKEVKRLDGQLDEIKQQQAQPVQQVQKLPEEEEWESENPWIFDETDPRRDVAMRVYAEQINSGKTIAGALRAVDRAVARIESESPKSARRPAASAADSSRTATAKRGNESPSVTWDSLSHEDVAIYEADPSIWGSKAEFLKSVANSRR